MMREQNITAIDRATIELLGAETRLERRFKESEGVMLGAVLHMEGGPSRLLPTEDERYNWRFTFDSTQGILEARKEHVVSKETSPLQDLELQEIAMRVHEVYNQHEY